MFFANTHKKSASRTHTEAEICAEALQNRHAVRHRFFFGYAYDLFRHAKFYTIIKDLLAYVRKFRTVAITVKILSIIFTVLQAGALVILSTAIFLVVLPILVALMLGILLTALIESRKSNRYMEEKLHNKRIYVLFLSKRSNAFFRANAKDLAKKENCAVLVVSPYWISGKGLTEARFFCTVREEQENIYLVRRYYFFKLKKLLLNRKNLTYMY